MSNDNGFTLMELLVVIMIIAAIAGGVVLSLGDTEDEAGLQLARSEILKIKEALLKFKQDTGYFPGQGPFCLQSLGGTCAIPDANLPAYVLVLPTAAEKQAWAASPANFWLLFGRDVACNSPLCGTGHALENWNPDTRRGWRGPYLTRHGEGLVDIGDNLATNGTGDPTAGALISRVRGVADPFVAAPRTVPASTDPDGALLDWRTLPTDTPHDRWGRPYFLFDLANNNARIVGMGKNRTYNAGTDDDIVLYLLK